MTVGLSVSRIIALSLSLSTPGAQFANLNTLLVLGQSDVIDTTTRIESYNTLADVAARFGTSAPEYLAAKNFFAVSPQPTQLFIGRWAQAATNGRLFCQPLTAAQQVLANFTAITSGGFKIKVDGGSLTAISAVNLSGAANLNAVATLITTALSGASIGAVCTWDGSKFIFKSSTTGASSKVEPLQAPASGTDLAAVLFGKVTNTILEVDGIVAESLLAATTIMDGLSTYWFGLNDDACTSAVDADRIAVAGYIEAAGSPHMYGFTSAAAGALSTAAQTDIGAVLQAAGYQKTFVHYSSSNAYAATSIWGNLLTTNFAGSDTMKTVAFKQEAGITAELLTATQASALDSKGYNYFAKFNNGVSILVNGWCVCSSPTANQIFIDEMFGALALANEIQTDYFNLLVTQPKVPQTDAGSHLGSNAIETALVAFVRNGFLAPGQWNAAGFGQLATGDFLERGYYIYTPLISSQQQSDRTARKSVPYQIAAKTAGAIQSASIILNVNP